MQWRFIRFQIAIPTSAPPRFLVSIVGAGLFVHSPFAAAQVPRGVFSLSPAGVAFQDTVLSNPSVDGVGIRQDWRDLEPTEGVYNWDFLDSQVARVAAAGKKVLLRINTQ